MNYVPNCSTCGVELSFINFGSVRDINNKVVKCCRNCAEPVLSELKEKRFVETYKDNDIYIFEGRYYPYWGCAYSYDAIDGARSRIDNKGIAIVPSELLGKVLRGENLL